MGVSEILKSAGHFSVSFTQRISAAYFSGVKSTLNRERSFGSTGMIRYRLLAVWPLDNRIDVERTQNVRCSFVINNDHPIASWRDKRVVHSRHRILVAI
jgi:hypothetical protein